MAGYAVSGRVDRAAVHTGRAGVVWLAADPDLAETQGDPDEPVATTDGPVAVDLVGRPLEDVIEERLATARAAWAMATFFLFDAEGWR